jgi:hypothetical protein
MKDYAITYGGLKQLLVIYGLSVDDTLNSVKVTSTSTDHDHASVKIDYTLLGKPLSSDSQLVLIDGRWYSQDLINSEHAQHEQLLHPAPASTAPAPASSSPAPSSTAPTPVQGALTAKP